MINSGHKISDQSRKKRLYNPLIIHVSRMNHQRKILFKLLFEKNIQFEQFKDSPCDKSITIYQYEVLNFKSKS